MESLDPVFLTSPWERGFDVGGLLLDRVWLVCRWVTEVIFFFDMGSFEGELVAGWTGCGDVADVESLIFFAELKVSAFLFLFDSCEDVRTSAAPDLFKVEVPVANLSLLAPSATPGSEPVLDVDFFFITGSSPEIPEKIIEVKVKMVNCCTD